MKVSLATRYRLGAPLLALLLLSMLLPAVGAVKEERRVALVVGIDAYEEIRVLHRAKGDAVALEAVLRTQLGFHSVVIATDADRAGFKRAFETFLREAKGADLAVLAFSGHGVEVEGVNLLLPADIPNVAAMPVEKGRRTLEDRAFDLAELTQRMRGTGAKLSVLLIDACRDNPLMQPTGRSIGSARGLGPAIVSTEVYTVFSAGPGQQALDGLSRDDPEPTSLFMRHLLPELIVSGQTLDQAIKATRAKVFEAARSVGHYQLPAIYSETLEDPILVPKTKPSWRVGSDLKECEACPEMVVLPGGRYMMMRPADPRRWRHQTLWSHWATIPGPFAVGRYEITFAEWDACVADGGCGNYRPDDEGWGRGRLPVINVSWNQAQSYVHWLNSKVPAGPADGSGPYRLLLEAEWEYVARAGTLTAYVVTSRSDEAAITMSDANFNGPETRRYWHYLPHEEAGTRTVPVGSYEPNRFSLYDMQGNVWEWVADCWRTTPNINVTTYLKAPEGEGCTRTLRGGGWSSSQKKLSFIARDDMKPQYSRSDVGFRVARTLD